jgi:hypothetical protein
VTQIKMKAYRSLKTGKYFELGRYGAIWYASLDPAIIQDGKAIPTLVPMEYIMQRNGLDGHELGQIEEVVFEFQFCAKHDNTPRCFKCGGALKPLKTRRGDPDGLKVDMQCKKCRAIFGQSNTKIFELID